MTKKKRIWLLSGLGLLLISGLLAALFLLFPPWLRPAPPDPLQYHLVTNESGPSRLIATRHGKVVWEASFSTTPRAWVSRGERIYIAAGDIFALSTNDGKHIWQRSLPLPFPWTNMNQEPRTLFWHQEWLYSTTSANHLVALIPESGQVHWEFASFEGRMSPPLFAQERIYVAITLPLGTIARVEITALAPRTGTHLWSRTCLLTSQEQESSSPVLQETQGAELILSFGSSLVRFQADSGKILQEPVSQPCKR